MHCLAVRGPLSLKELQGSGVVGNDHQPLFFDPAILTPFLFPDLADKPKSKGLISIIPHYSDIQRVQLWQSASGSSPNIINPYDDPLKVAEEIARSELVIPSSLHGLILADVLNVHSSPLRFSNNKEPILKYEDYYLGFDRAIPKFSTNINEALRSDPVVFSYKRSDL